MIYIFQVPESLAEKLDVYTSAKNGLIDIKFVCCTEKYSFRLCLTLVELCPC